MKRGLYLTTVNNTVPSKRFVGARRAGAIQTLKGKSEPVVFLTIVKREGPYPPACHVEKEYQLGVCFDTVRGRWERFGPEASAATEGHLTHTLLWDFSDPSRTLSEFLAAERERMTRLLKNGEDVKDVDASMDYSARGSSDLQDYLDYFCHVISDLLGAFSHGSRAGFFSLPNHVFHNVGGDQQTSLYAAMVLLRRGFKALGIVDKGVHIGSLLSPDLASFAPYVKKMVAYGRRHGRFDGQVHGGFDPIQVFLPRKKYLAVNWEALRMKAPTRKTDTHQAAEHIRRHVVSLHLGPMDGEAPLRGKAAATLSPPRRAWKTARALSTADQAKARGVLRGNGYVFCTEYAYRFDTRPPVELAAFGGLMPNATRDDRQELVKLVGRDKAEGLGSRLPSAHRAGGTIKKETLDNYRHQFSGDEGSDFSGYVSTSYNPLSALGFQRECPGYLYIVRVHDAVDVLATFANPPVGGECELSHPGPIPWEDIIGWRYVPWFRGVHGAERAWGMGLALPRYVENDAPPLFLRSQFSEGFTPAARRHFEHIFKSMTEDIKPLGGSPHT